MEQRAAAPQQQQQQQQPQRSCSSGGIEAFCGLEGRISWCVFFMYEQPGMLICTGASTSSRPSARVFFPAPCHSTASSQCVPPRTPRSRYTGRQRAAAEEWRFSPSCASKRNYYFRSLASKGFPSGYSKSVCVRMPSENSEPTMWLSQTTPEEHPPTPRLADGQLSSLHAPPPKF